jgi:uncharacterized protein
MQPSKMAAHSVLRSKLMKRSVTATITTLTLAAIAVVTVYGGIHYTLWLYFSRLFPPTTTMYVLATLGFSSILCLFFARWKRIILTRFYYILGTLWMGTLLISFIVVTPFLITHALFHTPLYPAVVFTLIATLVVLSIYSALRTTVRKILVPLPHLPKNREGFTIVQLSDLHIGDVYGPGSLRRTVNKANALNPDIIVITGDLFDGGGELYTGMIAPLADLKAKHGVYFVRGNHEIHAGLTTTERWIREHGVRILDDELITIADLQIIGLSYPEDMTDDKEEVLARLTKKASKQKPIILLRHEPAGVDDAIRHGVHLQLSGHTHHGQIWPLSHAAAYAYRFSMGLHTVGDFTIYISPGIGTWGPPMRLGSRSEITLVKLTRSQR